MKKTILLSIIVLFIQFMCTSVIAEETEPRKIGDYYFKKDSQLRYSTDGINFSGFTPSLSSVDYPIYGNGLYFVSGIQKISVHYMTSGNNSPVYVYDSNLNLINKIEFENREEGKDRDYFYLFSCKYDIDGYFYLKFYHSTRNSVVSPSDYKILSYRTKDGINLEPYNDPSGAFIEIVDKPYLFDNEIEAVQENEVRLYSGAIFSKDKVNGYELAQESRYRPIWHTYTTMESNDFPVLLSVQVFSTETFITVSLDGFKWTEIPNAANLDKGIRNDDEYLYITDILNPSKSLRFPLSSLVSPNEPIKVIYNNKYLIFNTPPVIENERTLVPLRFISEQMGYSVTWDQNTQTAIIYNMKLFIDSNIAVVNDTEKNMDVPARLINSTTMVPLRFIIEGLGGTVTWDESTNTAIINK